MSPKKDQQSESSWEDLERAAGFYRQFIHIYPEELSLWTRRTSKNLLEILRDIVVLGVPGFFVLRLIEFWQWRVSYLNNLTFAGAIRYVNQFSKGE